MKIMKKEAKELREEIKIIVQNYIEGLSNIQNCNCKLNVFCEIHEDWFCKNGSVKRKDILNREKFLIDSVFGALGIDDKFIFEHTMKKVQDKKEYAIVKITKKG